MPTQSELSRITDQIGEMTESVFTATRLDKFDLRRILRFLTKVIQIIEQSFQDVLSVLIDFKYLTKDDIKTGKLVQLSREIDLLQSRSRYRDAEEICSRLHHLSDYYRMDIEPLIKRIPNSAKWTDVFQLLNEYEGRIITLVNHSLSELQAAIPNNDPKSLNSIAASQFTLIQNSLIKLRSLNNEILGLSGHEGLLELTEHPSSLENAKIYINKNDYNIRDIYKIEQAGTVGPNSKSINTRISKNIHKQIGMDRLSKELTKLYKAMKVIDKYNKHTESIVNVEKAKRAALSKSKPKVIKYLKAAGKWALDTATKIGVPVAIELLKQSNGK
jgi:hypothetical protein